MDEHQAPEMRHQPKPTEDHASPDQARQGLRGRPVLMVLIGGMVLGVLYIAGMMLYSDRSADRPAPGPQGALPPPSHTVMAPAVLPDWGYQRSRSMA